MLEIKNLNITLKKDERSLLKNFNFTLNKKDRAVIIGEEGDGKSTLLKLLYDCSSVSYCDYSGEIIKHGIIGFLEQEAISAETVIDEFFIACDKKRVISVLSELKLSVDIIKSKRKLSTFSGGEKVKIRLARVLADNPDILLLDEPTNDIDLKTLEWLELFMKNCRLPVIYVSHDETFIENTANVIIHLEQIKKKHEPRHTVVRSNYKDYIEQRFSALQKQEQLARKQRSDHKEKEERWQQIFEKVEYRQDTISRQDPGGARLLKKKMKSLKSQEKRIEKEKDDFLEIPAFEEAINLNFNSDIKIPSGKRILELKSDELTAGAKILSKNIYLEVTGPEHIGIIGDNGIGKTTLLKKINEMLIKREDIKTAYMPQNYIETLPYDNTPVEYLTKNSTKDEITRIRTYMGRMKYTEEEMLCKIGDLSGGQKAKLLVLYMILHDFDVLLLDEPTRNFSPLSNPVIRKMLTSFKGTIICVTHDRKYISEVCSKVYELTTDGLKLK